MRPTVILVTAVIALGAPSLPPAALPARADGGFPTALLLWRAADNGFHEWALSGVARTADGALTLEPATAQPGHDPPGAYDGGHFYNGGAYFVGEATSPMTGIGPGFSQAVASWNAETPPGSWIEVLARARVAGRETKFYHLGVWASDGSAVARHSVKGQRDGDGTVAVDTLVLASEHQPADGLQVTVRLFSERPAEAVPVLHRLAVTTSPPPRPPAVVSPGEPSRWTGALDVPTCSQKAYPDGGQRWCSPTSTSMVLGYWSGDTGPCEPRVRAAVAGVYDHTFAAYGNWSFNAAYAATAGLESYVVRFGGLDQLEPWLAAGVPVVMSYAWTPGTLDGAPVRSSDGHLGVLVGFDAAGNPVMNDPAGATDGEVRRTYQRAQLEHRWLAHSGGTAYLMFPPDHPVPPLV